MAKGGGFAAAVLVIMFSEQAFLNAGPLVIRGLQGAAAAGFIFNVLMIARAPLQLFQAVSTSILPHLTSLHTSEEPGSENEFHRTVRMVLLGLVAFTALALVFMAAVGPTAMQIAFSNKFTYDREGLLLVTLGMGLYLGSVTVNQACIAQGQVRRAAAAGSPALPSSSAGTSCRSSATSSAGWRLASCSLRASSSRFSTTSTAARTNVPRTSRCRARRRSWRRSWR